MYLFGMTIGLIFAIIYTSTSILENKKWISYFLQVVLFTYILTNMINYYFITKDNLIVNKIEKEQVEEIANYLVEYEKENNIQVKYIAMRYIPNHIDKGYYKKTIV